MKKIFSLIFLLLISVSALPLSYEFTRLDNTHGLSNNQIESIFKDSRGFMWFGTNYGMNRYDGYKVKVYKSEKNDTTSLIYNVISDIQEDVNGNLWMRGNPQYVVYDIRKEHFIRNLSSILAPLGINFIPGLVNIDEEKNYYFYQYTVGIFKYDVKKKKLVSFKQGGNRNSLSRGNVIGLKGLGDSFWVLYDSGILERFNEKTNRVDIRNSYVKNNSADATIAKNLYVDKDGCPWIYPGIEDKGVLFFDVSTMQWTYFGGNKSDFKNQQDVLITTDFVRDVEQERNGDIWIGTDHGGICIFNKKSRQIKVLVNDRQNPNSISQNTVISLYADDSGIMWVGTYKNGVSFYHPEMFKFEKSPFFYYQNPLLENKDVNSLHEDSQGNLWIGTNGSGLLRYNKNDENFQIFRHNAGNPSSISSDIIISSLLDKSGVMWFGTFLGGLNRYTGTGFKRYLPVVNDPNSLSNKSIYGLVEDENQNLWIGTLGGGLDKLSADRTQFKRVTSENLGGLSSNYVLSVSTRDKKNIFVSTAGGLDVINTEKKSIRQAIESEELVENLTDLITTNSLLDSRDQLWIATDNGINIYNEKRKTIRHINMINGLPSDQVVSLVEDNDGNVWVGTRNGLACVYCKVNEESQECEYNVVSFDENDGLVSSIFNQNATFKNNEGLIYFGSTGGYTVFNPKNIRFNESVPKPQITGFMIGNEEIKPNKKFKNRIILDESINLKKKIVLKHNENNLSILFSAMSYIHLEKNQYKYRLKGLDDEWNTTKNGVINYSNLNFGNYELTIFASNNDNVWSKEPLVLEIVVKPPFWLSWLAILFYILLLLYLVWFAVDYNFKKQRKKFEDEKRMLEAQRIHEMDEMKIRFFTNISHEFRTPLTLIINPVEKMMKEVSSPDHKNLLSIIQRNTNGLLELVNQLLDFRRLDVQKDKLNLSTGDIVVFVKDICYTFSELANKKSINFSFSTSIPELKMEFDAEKMRKVVYNLLSNAIKFTSEKGKIDVHVGLAKQTESDRDEIQITVTDSGIGISKSDLEHVFERFYRVENSENGYQTGTGVGLHIVEGYVKLHDGRILVESEPAKGSSFIVQIPAKQQIQEEIISTEIVEAEELQIEEVELETENEVETESTKKQPTMLVVDDNADFRNFIASIFTNSYRILTAGDGEEALKVTLNKMPDLIISDVMMPKMDGYDFCRKVKEDIRISHIPIILLTAKTGDENKFAGLKAGAEDYISKPFKMELLELKVSRIIERQQQTHENFRQKVDITPSEVEVTSMDEKFVKKAVKLVEENMNNPDFLVEDLCREMGMSRVYFYKKISTLTDKTPSEFIRFIRLKRAASMLEKSQLYINEVAYRVGFNDVKYFRKYFKDEFGVSPTDYKKRFENQ